MSYNRRLSYVIKMFLKKIEMENFKSFGKKTEIEFRGGYTSVTGPNASGKSNIGDALLFVLGTKSNKSLRAQKLTDLIHRNPSGKQSSYLRASVTFDNSDRTIPLDSNEVTFTRVVKLSESNDQDFSSYYYINDDRARLQDFEYLLEKVKIFADGYNFVRQGDITRIIEMTPLERRGILEEVGGISSYNNEIEKADEEKDKTKENMVTVQALISELSGRVELLSKEKEQAETYLSKKKEIDLAESVLIFRKKREIENEIETIKEQNEKINGEIESTENRIKELLSKNEELEAKLNLLKTDNKELEEFEKIKSDLDSRKIEYSKMDMERENIQGKVSQIKHDISDLSEKKKKVESELKKAEDSLSTLVNNAKSKKDKLKELELSIQDMENKSTTSMDRYEQISKRISALSEEKEKKLKEIAVENSKLSSLETKNSSITEEISSIEEEIGNIEFSIKDTDWRIKSGKKVGSQGGDLNKEYLDIKKRMDELRREEEELTSEIEALEGELGKMQGVKLSGVWESINFINSESSKGSLKGVKGTVDSLISYPKEYDKAVRAAGGGRLLSVVVEDDKCAQEAIELLKKKGKGRVTFLPLNKIIPLRPKGKAIMLSQDSRTMGLLSDKIKADSSLENIVSYVFSDTILLSDMNIAREVMGGVRLVTLDGDLIDPSNAMTGGTLPKREISKDLETIANKLSSLKTRRVEIRALLSNLESDLRAVTEKINKLHAEAGKGEGEANQLNERRKELEDQLRKKRGILEEKKKLMEIVSRDIGNEKKIIDDLTSKIKSFDEENIKLNAEKEKVLDKKTREEIRVLKQKYADAKNEVENDEARINEHRILVSSLMANHNNTEETLKSRQEELQAGKNELDNLQRNLDKLKKDLEVVTSLFKEKEIKLKDKGNEAEKISNEKYKIRSEIDAKNTVKKTKLDFLLSLKSKLDDAMAKLGDLDKTISERKLEFREDQRSADDIKKDIAVLENQLHQMEPVNLKSINDYGEEKARLDELLEKKEKLEGEMNRLDELEKRLEEQKKVIFLEVFEAVNKNFINIYKELTDGGEGYLLLENVTNPFEGGLVIKASSRGKKIDNIASLSGGEKSLAALSFIIAIQNYDPSPIYFMDEVDMFLDGVNAENVGRLFRRGSENAQIIAVTLRKATMKYANQVIGVTFQDKNSTVFTKELAPQEVVS